MNFRNFLIVLILIFSASCARDITVRTYTLSMTMENGSGNSELLIRLPADLSANHSGDCEYKEAGKEYEHCYVQTVDDEINITLDTGFSDAGRVLSGVFKDNEAKGVVKLRSFGEYPTVGRFIMRYSGE
jgi:hypothetical protein